MKFIDYEKIRNYSRKDFLKSLGHFKRFCLHLGLADISRTIIITGSSGKGTTAQMVSELLTAHGCRTGLYTSPHLIHVTERIRLNNVCIPVRRFEHEEQYILRRVRSFNRKNGMDYTPTFFELLTLIALHYFKSERVDFTVLEVGLGGRLDATNIHHPVLTFILPVCLDHTRFLGRTRRKILKEKQEVIRRGSITVTGIKEEGLLSLLRKKCRREGSPLFIFKKDFHIRIVRPGRRSIRFVYREPGRSLELDIPVTSEGILRNAGLVLCGLGKILKLDPVRVRKVLGKIRFPGRFQVVRGRYIIDVGHNSLAVDSFIKTYRLLKEPEPDIIFTMMNDKKAGPFLERLSRLSPSLILTRVNMEREYDIQDLFRIAKKYFNEVFLTKDLANGLALARRKRVVIIGSFYLAGRALRILKGENTDEKH
ncbi:MAG: hypothetical protein PHF84_11400 [bacterium]|nr:hypothetical protein [bacterium]